ncbi:MAG TPA: non-canonical purine NTP pyrophosphatase, partial [Verrucomicrobiae bacterium]|nr:non-canonical purine NTP pyrophosphatase [Verrucomicrobiae bacterium]
MVQRMVTLVIATRNAHKVGEIRAILGELFRYRTLNDFPGAPQVIEDANTFAGNATKKAVELAKWISSKHRTLNAEYPTPNYVLADDSGLEVDALGGAPGVHSARFAALDRNKTGSAANSVDADNNAKLLRLLKDLPAEKRTARFHCVLALVPIIGPRPGAPERSHGGSPVCYADEFELQAELFDGVCEGRMGYAPRGQGGFGYDPLFFPNGYKQTF